MNKDIQNLILSYFTIKIDNYLTTNEPTTFAINSSTIFYLIDYSNNNDIFYMDLYNSYLEVTELDQQDIVDLNLVIKTPVLSIEFVNGFNSHVRFKPEESKRILSYYKITNLDLLTTYRILIKKYNTNLAKQITLAKLNGLIRPNFISTVINLLDSYRTLLIEFKILNLEGPVPKYTFNNIVIAPNNTISNDRFAEIVYTSGINGNSIDINVIKQSLANLSIDVDKMYKQILKTINKF